MNRGSADHDPEWPVRIPLSNEAFEGNNNAYLFAAGGEVGLVDTGVATPDAREELRARLADRGIGFADVDAVALTHWHADHAGLAGAIQAAGGATVHVHPADAPLVERDEEAWSGFRTASVGRYEAWGMPPDRREELIAFLESTDDYDHAAPETTPVEDGDRLELGGTSLDVLHLPGHTAGLVGFALDAPGGRDLLTGDALLPVYTPNVGGADLRVERPLATYLDTLDRIASGGYRRALPGHRDPIADPAARAREIADHHADRARRVVDTLDRIGPADAWTVSADLFGDLSGIHVLHGPGEAWAHLEHLERVGHVRREGREYRLAGDPTDIPGDLLGRGTGDR
ncbi:MBL fold metallo-hydrolase [Halobacteriales archaeon QS_8_69_26]|nr:MAG: MBL fold metallo-hydrolase [Halobacteriales archaeon QS_8_69_26]